MLDECNPLVESLRNVKEKMKRNNSKKLRLRLIKKRNTDPRVYNLPHVSEVAALIVGEVDINKGDRDIIIEYKCGKLQRISELHPSYLALQYPLFFPYGEDGYTEDIQYRQGSIPIGRKRRTVSMREFFAYKLQMRDGDHSLILYGGKLLQ